VEGVSPIPKLWAVGKLSENFVLECLSKNEKNGAEEWRPHCGEIDGQN